MLGVKEILDLMCSRAGSGVSGRRVFPDIFFNMMYLWLFAFELCDV